MRIFDDWAANRGRLHIQIVLALFRLAQIIRGPGHSRLRRAIATPAVVLYRAVSLFGLGIDIPVRTHIEAPLTIHHGIGLVVHAHALIGARVVLRQGVTIGAKSGQADAPEIGDDVNVGSGAQIIGGIRIGAGAQIGAGAVVIHDVPPHARAVGNPARVLADPAR